MGGNVPITWTDGVWRCATDDAEIILIANGVVGDYVCPECDVSVPARRVELANGHDELRPDVPDPTGTSPLA